MEKDKNELLDRYMAGESLTNEQKKQVEQWLHQDADLRDESQLLLQMYEWGRQHRIPFGTDRPQVQVISRPFAWAAAASVALIASAGLWWYYWGGSDFNRVAVDQSITRKVAVYEKRDGQLGFAKNNRPADSTLIIQHQIVTSGSARYWFASHDTLQIQLSPQVVAQSWYLVRVNEVDYQLITDSSVYPLTLGRQLWLPLKR